MELKKIEQANKLFLSIKKLDAEIIELDKFAQLLLNGGSDTRINLSFEPKKEKKEKVKFDEDGSLITGTPTANLSALTYTFSFSGLSGLCSSSDKSEKESELKQSISENTMLQVIGVLIGQKNNEREIHLKGLTKMGFKL